MKDLDTAVPPSLHREEGEFYLHCAFQYGGESYLLRVPLGDGRYHAERVMQLIVAPAIAPRVGDR
jgi:hypothetical protein